MQLALTFDDVDHFVVHVAVVGRAPGRDHAEELRDVQGSDFLVDEVPELAIAACRKSRPVRVADRPPFRVRSRVVALRRADREDDELLRPRIVELEGLARRDEGAGVGFELVFAAVDNEGAVAGNDEQNLLDSLEAMRLRAPGCTANQPLFEPLRARAPVDRHLHGGGVLGVATALDSRLGNDEAAHHLTASALTRGAPKHRSPGWVAACTLRFSHRAAKKESSAADRDDEVAVLVQPRRLAGRDHQRGDRRPDDGGTRNGVAGSQPLEVVAGNLLELTRLVHPRLDALDERIGRVFAAERFDVELLLAHYADPANAEADELDPRLAIGGLRPVLLLVEPFEQLDRLFERVSADVLAGEGRGDDVNLTAVAHVDRAVESHLAGFEALGLQLPRDPRFQLGIGLLDRAEVERSAQRPRDLILVGDVGGDEAEGAVHGSGVRDHDRRDSEIRAVRADVHAGRAAEREEREAARVEPALHRGLVQEVVEEAVRELVHRRRGLDRLEAERLGDLLLEETSRVCDVELGATTQEVPGIEIAEDRVDVGDGRLGAAMRVADGAGVRPGALRANPRRTGALVDRDDAPARKAQRDHIHLRKGVVVAEDERFTLVLDQPLTHRADLEGGASHVRGDDVPQPEFLSEALRADETADRA